MRYALLLLVLVGCAEPTTVPRCESVRVFATVTDTQTGDTLLVDTLYAKRNCGTSEDD